MVFIILRRNNHWHLKFINTVSFESQLKINWIILTYNHITSTELKTFNHMIELLMWMRVATTIWINQIQSMTCFIQFYFLWIEVVFLHLTLQTNSQIHSKCFFVDFDCPWLFWFECFWESRIQQTKLIVPCLFN